MKEKTLFLLDAYALIYRAYYALIASPRFTKGGFNTSAVFGFVNTLDDVLRNANPSHIAVCFDPKGDTFRHQLYPEYKANREAQPEDITLSVPIIKDIIKAYNIPMFEVDGYEADDVIGTLSKQAAAEGYTVYMMTPDKDFGQLVTDKIFMYKPSLRGQGAEVRGPKEICERYEIERPEQVIDLLALEGDKVDNIPGCPGVGPKTASKLIKEWHSVANMLDHAGEIKGALGSKIRDNAENIRFSYDLATIRTDVPVEVDFNTLCRGPENVPELMEIFTKYEFKTFIMRLNQRMGADPAQSSEQHKTTAEPQHQGLSLFDFVDSDSIAPADILAEAEKKQDLSGKTYIRIESADQLIAAVKEAIEAEAAGIALYAPGMEAMRASFDALAFAVSSDRGWFVPLAAEGTEARRSYLAILRPLFSSAKLLVSTDIKRDMVLLRREGIVLTAPYFDVLLAHYILQPELRRPFPELAEALLGYRMFQGALDRSSRKGMTHIVAEELPDHLCELAAVTLRMYRPLADLLEENGQASLNRDIEQPLAKVLADMEWVGVRIDVQELAVLSVELNERIEALEQQAYDLVGHPFNLSSPMQVGEVLFGELKLDPKAKRTKKGGFSTSEEILLKHRSRHPIVDLILKARQLKKLLATYVQALPELVNPRTGKIHTTYNQTVTATGRISSSNPNLQNVPIRTEDGQQVRRAFIADEGCLLLSADYSQIELRLLAALSHDPELTDAFRKGLDIHRATAAKLYNVPFDEVTDLQRRRAKTANFGTIYGISSFGLADRLNIPRSEAKQLIDGYFATYPHIKQYIAESIERASRDGYVSTIMGRKRFLHDINSRNPTVRSYAERNAVNAPLQGSAADIIKKAMIDIHAEMTRLGLRSKMIMQVHDELIFNVIPEELPVLGPLVERLMSGAFSGEITLEVSEGTGHNWLEAH